MRFQLPQNSKFQTQNILKAMNVGAQDVEVLNAEEGIVRLSFADVKRASLAAKKMKKSKKVVKVSRNLFYKPQVKYTFRKTSKKKQRRILPPAIPFFSIIDDATGTSGSMITTEQSIPEVLLPPTEVIAGADALVAQDWALKSVNLDLAETNVASSSMITAVLDTGVDYNHEDLVGAMWRHPDNEKEVGFDFAQNRSEPYDLVHFDIEGCMKDFMCQAGYTAHQYLVNPGHGTHCAGHVAAVANNSLGIRGAGAGAQVMALKFFYDVGHDHAGQGDDAAAIKSIDYAIKNGAKIISASWGGRQPREDAEKSELLEALKRAQTAGVLVVIAAGNDAIDNDTDANPTFPASYALDNLITVAATDPQDKLAEFSSYGMTTAHIAAPGTRILSTVAGGTAGYSDLIAKFLDSEGKEQEIAWDGTSMATPIVAGAAALVWSKYPHETYQQIRERILSSARKVPALEGKVATSGILDVAAALAPREAPMRRY